MTSASAPSSSHHGVPLRTAVGVWARVGRNSFGGPAGQIAVMHREVVEQRRWVDERRFLHALNYCLVLPGPEAQQLATYLGWLMHGVPGGVLAGTLFVLPGFVVMLAVAAGYAAFGDVSWVSALLLGIQAAVVAVVAEAVLRIGRRTLRARFLQVLAGAAFVAVFVVGVPFPLVVLAGAAAGLVTGRVRPQWLTADRPADRGPGATPDGEVPPGAARAARRAAAACAVLWLVPVALLVALLAPDQLFRQQALLFSQSAVITFGGAYAALGYVAQQAVGRLGWISPGDMLTGLGLAETTPGPLILVLQFVAFVAAYRDPGGLPPLLAGALAATLTAWVTFVPCFLFVFAGAPMVERLRGDPRIAHALTAVGATVAGVVLNLAAWFAVHTLFGTVRDGDLAPLALPVPQWSSLRPEPLAICLLALVLVFRLGWSTPRLLLACGGLGILTLALTG